MDKHDRVGQVLEDEGYGFDDLVKLLCRVFAKSAQANGEDKASIRKVIYGEGSKFILRINMLPQEWHEGKLK